MFGYNPLPSPRQQEFQQKNENVSVKDTTYGEQGRRLFAGDAN